MSLPNFIIQIPIVLLFTLHITKNIAYRITEVLIFYAHKLMLMGSSKNLRVFNFAILPKSRKFDAHEIYVVLQSLKRALIIFIKLNVPRLECIKCFPLCNCMCILAVLCLCNKILNGAFRATQI